MRRLRVLLDANVLVNAQVRDVFLTAAELELIDVYWSGRILMETKKALVENRGLPTEKVDRLLGVIAKTFPLAEVIDYEARIGDFDLPDPDDRHVLAAALEAECDLLVTFNDKDFQLVGHESTDIDVMRPDDAIELCCAIFGAAFGAVVTTVLNRLKRPGFTTEEYLQKLSGDAPRGAVALGVVLKVPGFAELYQDLLMSADPTSAQSAVRQLVDAMVERNDEAVIGFVDASFAAALTGKKHPSAAQIRKALARRLSDITNSDDWGTGTAPRPQHAEVELVKLVKRGDVPELVVEPTLRQAHLFFMRFSEGRWQLRELDGPDPAFQGSPSGVRKGR